MAASSIACELWAAAGGDPAFIDNLEVTGSGSLPSVFPVSDLAAAAVGCAGLAVAELIAARFGVAPGVRVDRRLCSIWFGLSVRPQGWQLPPEKRAEATYAEHRRQKASGSGGCGFRLPLW